MKDDSNYEKIANVFQALTNPTRLRILDVLIKNCECSKNECCVNDINEKIDLPQPYISKHLKVLKDCDILTYRKEANRIYYSFKSNGVIDELINYLTNCRKCC